MPDGNFNEIVYVCSLARSFFLSAVLRDPRDLPIVTSAQNGRFRLTAYIHSSLSCEGGGRVVKNFTNCVDVIYGRPQRRMRNGYRRRRRGWLSREMASFRFLEEDSGSGAATEIGWARCGVRTEDVHRLFTLNLNLSRRQILFFFTLTYFYGSKVLLSIYHLKQ